MMGATRSVGGRSGPRVELCEVAVFVFQILPSLVLSFFAAGQGGDSYVLGAAAIMARDLALLSLIAFFVWRNGEGAAEIGWRSAHALRELVVGVLLFVPVAAAMQAVALLLHTLGVPAPPQRLPAVLEPRGPGELALATALIVVVAVAEEAIFRGYLILRFHRLTRSSAFAILLSSAIFALGHGYEGAIGVVTIGVMGILLAVIRVWRRSLTAPIVIHFLQDFTSVVLLPLLASKR